MKIKLLFYPVGVSVSCACGGCGQIFRETGQRTAGFLTVFDFVADMLFPAYSQFIQQKRVEGNAVLKCVDDEEVLVAVHGGDDPELGDAVSRKCAVLLQFGNPAHDTGGVTVFRICGDGGKLPPKLLCRIVAERLVCDRRIFLGRCSFPQGHLLRKCVFLLEEVAAKQGEAGYPLVFALQQQAAGLKREKGGGIVGRCDFASLRSARQLKLPAGRRRTPQLGAVL